MLAIIRQNSHQAFPTFQYFVTNTIENCFKVDGKEPDMSDRQAMLAARLKLNLY